MSELAAKPDTAPRGQHLLGALALHPALARPFLIFSEYIATASSLSARDRELIILRISWLHRSEYEFTQHLILARGAGIGETQLREIEQGPDAPGWSADDAAVLRAEVGRASGGDSGGQSG